MSRRSGWCGLGTALVVFGSGCESSTGGDVIVHLGTDLPASSFDKVIIAVRSGEDGERSQALTWIEDASFGVRQPGNTPVELTVTLLSGETPMITEKRRLETFDPARTLHAYMYLRTASCDSALLDSCTPGQEVCGACGCESMTLETFAMEKSSPWECINIDDPIFPGDDAGTDSDPNSPDRREPDGGVVLPDAAIAPDAGGPDSFDGGGCTHGTSSNNRSYRAYAGRSLDFGTDEAFTLNPPATIDGWVRFTGITHVTQVLSGVLNAEAEWDLIIFGFDHAIEFQYTIGPEFHLELSCTYPMDGAWHHFAVEVAEDEGLYVVLLFIDGAMCNSTSTTYNWSYPAANLTVPNDVDPQLLLDGLRIRRSVAWPGLFTPEMVPSIDQHTIGLWLMDEDDDSTTAHDATCRNDAVVERASFIDDFPR